jgi:hypothetical protein
VCVPVQQPHLELAVRRDVLGHDDAGVRVGELQARAQRRSLPRARRRVPADREQAVRLAGRHERVVVAQRLAQPLGGLALRRAGHDAVDERVAERHRVVEPPREPRVERPPLGVRAHDRLQPRAVVLDQLARQHDDAARRVEVERGGALVQEARELAGERARRRVVERVGLVERDPDLGRVREHERQLRRARDGEHRVPLRVRRQRAAHARDHAPVLAHAPSLEPLRHERVQPVLRGEQLVAPAPVEPTATTRPLNAPRRFAASRKKSTKPRRNAPVPNCTARSGRSSRCRSKAAGRFLSFCLCFFFFLFFFFLAS